VNVQKIREEYGIHFTMNCLIRTLRLKWKKESSDRDEGIQWRMVEVVATGIRQVW
jgi:hypothetical protein